MAYLAPSEFVAKMVDAGESKIFMATRDTLIRAYMAGAILALAAVFAITISVQTGSPLVGAILFPVGFCILYLLGFDLLTGVFVLTPLTAWSAYAFGIAMGLLWLSTVPLTNGTVATLFGVRNLSMLGGIVFLFHQLGAFMGGWLGGYLYDRTGSYELVWQIAILLSLLAAALNWPVREQPVARLRNLEVAA